MGGDAPDGGPLRVPRRRRGLRDHHFCLHPIQAAPDTKARHGAEAEILRDGQGEEEEPSSRPEEEELGQQRVDQLGHDHESQVRGRDTVGEREDLGSV